MGELNQLRSRNQKAKNPLQKGDRDREGAGRKAGGKGRAGD